MIKYLDIDKFLNLVTDRGIVADIRKIEEQDIKELLQEIDQENTTIEKQVGFVVDNSFKGRVITTGNFTPLKLGDIIIIKDDGNYYISIIEESVV